MHVNLIANLTKFEKEYSQANLDVLGDVSKEWTEGIFSLFLTIALNWNAFLYCIFFSSYCWSNCLLTYSLSFIVILNSKRISCIWFLPLLLDLQPILPDCFILIAYIIQLKSSDTTLGVRWLWPGERQVKDLENDTASYAKKATFLGGKKHEQTIPQCLEYRKTLSGEKMLRVFFIEAYAVIAKLLNFLCQPHRWDYQISFCLNIMLSQSHFPKF